jgi:rhamnosyltransferase
MFDCSLVIRAFNEEQNLGRLLEGVHNQTVRNVEVILVDSGSSDATVAVAQKNNVNVLHIPPGEFTFGRSLNLGISAASSPVVVIASAHVYPVYPDWLEKLMAPFKDPKIALVYGRQRGSINSKFSEQQVFSRWYPEQSNLHQQQPFCNNANIAIRRSLWESHPYDETLTGLEDLAWGKWVSEQGFDIAYIVDAEVIHVHTETPLVVRNRYQREAIAFKQIYPEAHFNLYDFFRSTSSSIGFDILHAARVHQLWSVIPSIFWYRVAQFWGTYQGYRHSGLITPSLRQTFYYHVGWDKSKKIKRDMDPIRYNE